MRRFLIAALVSTGVLFASLASTQQVRYPGQVPQSWQTNASAQGSRDALGVALYDLLSSACGPSTTYGGCYDGLTITAVSGSLNVTVNAAATGGRIYQVVESNPNPMPSSTPTPPAPATPVPGATLPPDTQQIIPPATQVGNSASLSVPAPGTSGQSIYYLIEAKVTPASPSNSQVTTFYNSGLNELWTTTLPLDLVDTISYQAKAGTASSSPAVPSLDAGWVALGTVLVPYGATSCTTSCTIGQYPPLSGVPLFFVGTSPLTATLAAGKLTVACPTCAVTNADNHFSTGQTINGNITIPYAATIGNNFAENNQIFFGTSGEPIYVEWYRGGGGITEEATAGYTCSGVSNTLIGYADHGVNSSLFCVDLNGDVGIGGYLAAASSIIGGHATAPTCTAGDGCFSRSTTTGAIDIGGSTTACLFDEGVTHAGDFTSACPLYVPNLYDTGVAANSLACLSTGSVFAACTVSSPLSLSGTTLSLTTVPIALGGTNATSATTGCIGYNGTAYAHSNCVDAVGTGLSLTGTTASLTTPVSTANGGTGQTTWTAGDCVRASTATLLASAAGDCVTSVSGGNGITSTGGTTPAISVTNCAQAICRAKLEIPLCFQSGAVSTTATCPTQPVVAFSGGQITGLRAFCTGKDNGTTVFTLYTVNYSTGAQTSVGTLTLSSTNYESDGTITTVNLSAPEGLYGNVTTAGTASGCTFVAEGTQQVL